MVQNQREPTYWVEAFVEYEPIVGYLDLDVNVYMSKIKIKSLK
jgi:hypothetical protein